jgi:uncharacterized protein (DUF885 family)
MDIGVTFIEGAAAALAASMVAGMIAVVRVVILMKKSVEKLIKTDAEQTRAIQMIAKLQRPQLAAHKALLEAVGEGVCNGNVTKAKEALMHGFAEFDEYLHSRIGA